jgi:hypothetical protein
MSRRLAVVSTAASASLLAAAALAAPRSHPSDRACLLAWNAPSNHGNRLRLLAVRPISELSLRPGKTFTSTWTSGSAPRQTAAEACLLTLRKPGEIQVVTGVWRAGGVGRWSFGHPIPSRRPFYANVRLLPDGRVTRIYRH